MVSSNTTSVSIRSAYIFAAIFIVVMTVNNVFKIVTPEMADTGVYTKPAMMAGAVFGGLLAIANFQLAMVMFIFIAPLVLYTLPGLPFYFTIGDAYLVILIIVYIMRMTAGKERPFSKTLLDRSVFIFVLFSLFSMLKTRNFSESIKEIIQTLEYFVGCYYLFSFAISNRKFLDVLLDTILLVSTLVSIAGFYEYIAQGGSDYRILSTFGHFNANGTFLAMTTSLAFCRLITTGIDKKTKIMRAVMLGINIVALLLTFSRGAWIGTTIAIIVATQLRGMVSFMKTFSVIFVALILVSLFVPTNRYTERFKSISDTNESSSKSRITQYRIAYNAMAKYPLIGIGVSNSQYYVLETYNSPANAEIHNLFLHIGAERGIPAALVLIWIFIYTYRELYRKIVNTKSEYYNSQYITFLSTLVAYGTANLFAYMLVRGPAMYFAIFLGLFQATVYIEEHEHKEVEWAQLLSTIDLKRPTMRMGA